MTEQVREVTPILSCPHLHTAVVVFFFVIQSLLYRFEAPDSSLDPESAGQPLRIAKKSNKVAIQKRELEKEVQGLQGMLPICSFRKKNP
jgi:hypothetical protein